MIACLSNHVPKIYDESLAPDDELVFFIRNGQPIFNTKHVQCSVAAAAARNETSPQLLSSSSDLVSTTNKQRKIAFPLLIPEMLEYCITGLYNLDTFMSIRAPLLELMFYDTE